MKKKYLAIVILIYFVSCTKFNSDENFYRVNSLQKTEKNDFHLAHLDTNFQKVINYILKTTLKKYDIDFLKLMNQGKLQEKDFYKALGYQTDYEFRNDYFNFIHEIILVDKKYNLKTIRKDELIEAVTKTFYEIEKNNNLKNELSGNNINLLKTDCERQRKNCLVKVAAEAVIMHIGCAAADLSVVFGVMCHSAVITWQITASNECNYQSEQCSGANNQSLNK